MRMGLFICIWVLGFYQSLKWVLITHSNFFDRLIKKFHFCKTISGVKSKWHGQPFSRVKLTLKPTRSRIWSEVCNLAPRKVPSGRCAQLPLKDFLSLNLELRAKWPEGWRGASTSGNGGGSVFFGPHFHTSMAFIQQTFIVLVSILSAQGIVWDQGLAHGCHILEVPGVSTLFSQGFCVASTWGLLQLLSNEESLMLLWEKSIIEFSTFELITFELSIFVKLECFKEVTMRRLEEKIRDTREGKRSLPE